MLTRVLLPRVAAVSVGRLFATSVPRWNVPTSVEGTATAALDADAIRARLAQIKAAQKAQLKDRKERIRASIVARKAKRVEMSARHDLKERMIAKRKEIRARLLARAVARKEKAAARAASKRADVKAAALLEKEQLFCDRYCDLSPNAKRTQ